MKHIIHIDLGAEKLECNGVTYTCSCKVRNLRNGLRELNEVVRSIPDNKPYDPRPFPAGNWKVTGVEWQEKHGFSEHTYGPVKIRTNAEQDVKVWALDKDADYFFETADVVRDGGYLLHYSQSSTTLGCIRLQNAADAIAIASVIEVYLNRNEEVLVEVK